MMNKVKVFGANIIIAMILLASFMVMIPSNLNGDLSESPLNGPGEQYGVQQEPVVRPEFLKEEFYDSSDHYTNPVEPDYKVISESEVEPVETETFTNEFTKVPGIVDTDSKFAYSERSSETSDTQVESVSLSAVETTLARQSRGNNNDGDKGNKLGNAPEALYKVLEKFLAKGKMPPPNFPVPYKLYTNSSGVEKFTDALTKMPIQINVDNDKDTGQGNGKDIRVKTTISTNPLEITMFVERKDGTPAPDLQIYVSFPAFFYNGEAGDPGGEPYWLFGYETRFGSEIPEDITVTFSVDQSLGSEHVFDFDWSSDSGIDPLRFRFGTFQVVDQNTEAPILPAFASFEVSSPSFAGLTFETYETDTSSTKCMTWSAPTSFALSFNFSEVESLAGLDYDFPMTMTVDKVPQSFTICTTEDRAANTYSVDYTASSTVDLVQLSTEIEVEGAPTVGIDLSIEDMPAELHAVLGDGYLNVDVDSNVGLLSLDATADLGLAEIDNMINARLRVYDIPDFNATWYADGTGNGFALTSSDYIGSIELAFSFGDLVFPAEHDGDLDSHYLFAWSDPDKTAIAIRILGVVSMEFVQTNVDQSNSLSMVLADNNVLYVIVHSEVGGLLTPSKDVELDVVMTETPTEITVVWTVPFTLSIMTNDFIDSISADLTVDAAGIPAEDLTANADILDIPANMDWDIDPEGSISFSADASIGTLILEASDPNGLPGAKTFFDGEPIRILRVWSHDIPSFTAEWSTDEVTPWTSAAFNTAPFTSLGDITFGISTSTTSYATVGGGQDNRAMFYNDNYLNLGNGLVMEASMWMYVEDISRVELGFGGTDPTYDIGFGSSVPHDLKASVRLDRTSSYNPADADDDVNIMVVTTNLPTSMDLEITPEDSFEYDAQGTILSHIDVDASIGDLSPGAPDPADVNEFQLDVYDLPGSADGQWDIETDSGSIELQLEDDSELGRVELVADNAFGVLGTDFEHIEAYIDSLPEDVSADWDLSSRTGEISFTDGDFEGGLGEAFILATTMNESATTEYIESLDVDTSVSMTTYSSYEAEIDSRYWPGTTLENNLQSTYERNPELNTASDDYAVFRSGAGETVFTARIRELHSVDISVPNNIGHAEIQFTPGVTTDRQLYLRSEDVDPSDDDLILAELSELPNSEGENRFYASYDRTQDEYSFESSEVIDFIDVYIGTRESTNQTRTWYKFLLTDLPETAVLSFDLDDTTEGFLEFNISSNFELGVAIQDSNGRYAGWIELTGIRFDYEFYGPGDLDSKYSIGYYITRIDVDIHTLPENSDNSINGIFGIYTYKENPEDLIGPAFTAPDAAYIPEWTFILKDFTKFRVLVDWDVGITFSVSSSSSGSLNINLFPTISIELGFEPVIDYWWNDQVKLNIPHIPLPPFPPFLYVWMDGTITLNKHPDYIENKPIHLIPIKTAAAVTISLSATWKVYPTVLNIVVNMVIDVPGFHKFSDHPDPGA